VKTPDLLASDACGGVVDQSHGMWRVPRGARLAGIGSGGLLRRAMARLTLGGALGSYWLGQIAAGERFLWPSGHGGQCAVLRARRVGGELRICPSSDAAGSWRRDVRLRRARRAPVCSWSRLASSQSARKRSSAETHPAALAHLLRARATAGGHMAGRGSHTSAAPTGHSSSGGSRVGNAQRQRASETPAFRGQRAGVGSAGLRASMCSDARSQAMPKTASRPG
jgi:hypothetical protein